MPLIIKGSQNLKPIKFFENKGSAQCKSSVIFGGIKANGKTFIKAKKSRNHTELLFKYLKLPIRIKKNKTHDEIKIQKAKNFVTLTNQYRMNKKICGIINLILGYLCRF